MSYKGLMGIAEKENVEIIEMRLSGRNKGLYSDNVIAISSKIDTITEKTCVLAEELGHHFTTAGDILDQSKIENRRQERKARAWGYERLVSVKNLIQASDHGIRNRFELAEYLDVTEEFLDSALGYYKEKYGTSYKLDNYIIYFEPLWIYKSVR